VRVAYFGTPDDAVPPLRALVDGGNDVALVVTQPDRRRGRGNATAPSPVKAAAEELGLPVRTPDRARELVEELVELRADAGGQILPATVLGTTRLGFLNLHFSLLPRWRGAAPVERAILAGDPETGVCVMALDEGMDTGPVYRHVTTPIGAHETAGELRARLVELGTPLLVDTVALLPDLEPTPQIGAATHAAKLEVDEFRLDWTRPAADLDLVVRAGNPRPGAWTELDGQRFKVVRAMPDDATDGEPGVVSDDGVVATGAGGLRLLEVQPAGKAVMPASAWLAGRRGATVQFS
jgi:methionyl-tRNA formyltransferase